MSEMIRVTAKAMGTINGVDGSIIHVNPEGSDPVARKPLVDVRNVERLVTEGLIRPPKGYNAKGVREEVSVADAGAANLEAGGEDMNDTMATVAVPMGSPTNEDDGATPPVTKAVDKKA